MKILMGNLGYMRGINGSLAHHLAYAHRHVYCPPDAQRKAIGQLQHILEREEPDLCCFVEIDRGSTGAGINQLNSLAGERYPFSDIENKYGQDSRLRTLPHTRGKSNAFMAKRPFAFEKWYLTHGTKRLVYSIRLEDNLVLLFTHFSLKKHVRARQLSEIRQRMESTHDQYILLGDFNILTGTKELAPLLQHSNFRLINENTPTFRFHTIRKMLDLCIVSQSLISRVALTIIHQPYSDHDALLVELKAAAGN